jgi:hypothetical protein
MILDILFRSFGFLVPKNVLSLCVLGEGYSKHASCTLNLCLFVCLMVFNAIFNNISVISWRSVLLVGETGENHRPVASH